MPRIHFHHELEWYEYRYLPNLCKVGICHKTLQPCTVLYYSREKIEQLIELNKWNIFSLPIYQEALKQFPKEEQNEEAR